MPINTRQSSLLVAENWKKVYQTFKEADFTSYDFETLRKAMIDYIKLYYPEDFNDFTESSEFVALIDLIAFIGQSIAFRADLNARENFIDTAERRDSILKLAKLISYNPKRNIPASGLLKIDSVSTTETVYDSNGFNLSGLLVNWNDQGNDNWLEQFTIVVNSALISNQVVGKPGNSQNINGIKTDEYSLNLVQNILNVYKFIAPVENNNFDFEIVSATSIGKDYIYESPPSLTSPFNILYRNDDYGNSSNNTGFFLYFKQGVTNSQDFTITSPIPNRIVSVDNNNVNNTDVWLFELDSNFNLQSQWVQVPAVAGINVIYNQNTERNLFQVNTRANDQIDLVFGDGSFSNMPKGSYRVYYRTSNGLTYKITPDEMKGISIPFRYVSRSGRVETLTIRASLQYTVVNANARESIDEIREKAPQQYYTQNRMITGEDYNILPYTSFGTVIKAKSINRTSSGISRFLDVIDSTGKYSSTNIFCQDGVLYRENFIRSFRFKYLSRSDVIKILSTDVVKIINSKELLHFYYANYPTYNLANLSTFIWNSSTVGSNSCTGYFTINSLPAQIGGIVRSDAKYIRKGSIIRFRAPIGYHYDANNNLIPGPATSPNDSLVLYSSIDEVFGDGTNNGEGNFENGTGPVILNTYIPTGSIIDSVYPVFKNSFSSYFINEMTDLIEKNRDFGITYNPKRQTWEIVQAENVNINDEFSLQYQNNQSGQARDSSWLLRFDYFDNGYTCYYRGIEYIFHSAEETTFFFDDTTKIYDSKKGTVVKDEIKILKINQKSDSVEPLGKDVVWHIYGNYIDSDGYNSKDRILITYADSNNDGIPDDPELFNLIVNPLQNTSNKFVFFEVVTGDDKFFNLVWVDSKEFVTSLAERTDIENNINRYLIGQKFFAFEERKIYQIDSLRQLVEKTNYIAKIGRQNIYFQYRHNSPNNRRIDPSTTNVNDIYILTTAYESAYRNWLQDTSGTISQPNEPTTQELSVEFSGLNDIRSISDTIVFNSAKFKPLFGSKASPTLQANFKVVKNPSINVSDNEIKSSVINAVNTYFEISNWDFGETFYFSELSAYLHKVLSPNISSIIIVPSDPNANFGRLYQINAEPYEIIVSAATVENVEIISSLTASQLNMQLTSNSL